MATRGCYSTPTPLPTFVWRFFLFFKINHLRFGKKRKNVSFLGVYVCLKAKLTFVYFFSSFFFAPFSYVAMVKICDVVGNGMSFDISPLRPEQHDSDDSFWFSINGMPWDVVGIASPLTNYPVLPAFEMADDWKWPPYKSPHLLTVAFVGFHLSDQDDPI